METMKWRNRSVFLNKVSGYTIVLKQSEINNSDDKFVTATTIEPIMNNGSNVMLKIEDDSIHDYHIKLTCYDAIIYYKELVKVETQVQTSNKIIEDTTKYSIELPD